MGPRKILNKRIKRDYNQIGVIIQGCFKQILLSTLLTLSLTKLIPLLYRSVIITVLTNFVLCHQAV